MSTFKKIALGVSLLVIAALVTIVLLLHSGSDMAKTVTEQLQAIKAGDVITAYSYTSTDFQNATSRSEFAYFLDQYPALKTNVGITFTDKKIGDQTGTLKGIIYAADGAMFSLEYRLIKENGKWNVLSIAVTPLEQAIKTAAANAASTTPATESTALTNVYESKDSRFKINYPQSWSYETPEKGMVILSGIAGSASYYSTVNIQIILTKKTGGQFSSVKAFMTDVKKQLTTQSPDVKFLDKGNYAITMPDGKAAQGEYLVFSYTYEGQMVKQWQIVLLRDDNQVFYAWAYTAPIKQYDNDLPIAQAILKSWQIY